MKSILPFFLWFSALLILGHASRANHLLGGELGYTYVSSTGNVHTYKVTLSFFADCASNFPNGAYAALEVANPQILLYNGNSLIIAQNLAINNELSGVEITPVCPDEAGNTTCSNINNPIPGIRLYVYEGNFTLTGESDQWRFAFEGQISTIPATNAGRSNIIGNANIAGGSSLMYLEARLDNTIGANSTPVFSSLPTPFFCVNKNQNYSLGAIDPDGDNMTFGLVPAMETATTNLLYYTPYTATNPLPTLPGDFAFNNTNGQMTFIPSQALNCVVVNRVNEYRDGILVGTSMREMTFVILDNCNNDAPEGPITNTENVSIVDINGQEMFQVCAGQTAVVSYDINSFDPNGDNITVSWNNLPEGSAIVVDNNGTPNPVVHFLWNVVNAEEGNYTFYITYTDDGCPLASSQTLAYTLQVVPFAEQFTGGSIPPCQDTMNGLVWLLPQDNTGIEYDYYWYDIDGTLLQTTINSVEGDTFSGADVDVYTVKVVNPDGCRKFYNIVVSPSPYEVGINANDTLACVGTPMIFNANNTADIDTWTWDFGDGTPPVANQQITTHTYAGEGTYTVTLRGYTVLGCMDTATVQVMVDAPQMLTIIADKDSVCVGERIHLTASAGNYVDTLYWDYGNSWQISYPDEGSVSYVYETPGIYTISLNAAYRACPDKAAETTITVFPYPVVNLGNDTSLCLNGQPIILHNLVSQSAAYSSLWNTGDTTAFLKVVHPGTYSLTVASRDVVCKTTDEIVVKKACYLDIPNSFTPNGDGVNDYFLPRQLLGADITVFHMQVFDRWGQIVFETNSVDGRGWDGTLNGKAQPVGVYIYQITAVVNGDQQENYTGNVSLLR